ncbi:MAG: hypothetical protein ACI8RZ_004305 [Myxococcota bacterium]|jgi:hypothetical protein
MSPDTFSRALLATARIACCAAIFACDEVDCTEDTTSRVDTADTDTDTDTEDCPSALETCEETVADDFAFASLTNSDTEACCQRIAENYDELLETDTSAMDDWALREDCCSLLDWQGSMACTPWGPPRPPTAKGFSREGTARQVAAVRRAALA